MEIMDILNLVTNQEDVQKITSKLGGSSDQISKGIGVALPAMLEALNKNTSTKEGAESLNKALESKHDGSILNNLSAQLENPNLEEGQAILAHMFGGNSSNVAQAVSNSSGLDLSKSSALLSMLAPVVLGMLGKQKKENNLDASGLDQLTSMLSGGFSKLNPDLMGTIGKMISSGDSNDIMDNVMGAIGGLFGGKK